MSFLQRAGGVLALSLLLACHRETPHAPDALAPLPATAAVRTDREGIRHEGVAISPGKPFVWKLSAGTSGHLRFNWCANGGGELTLNLDASNGEALVYKVRRSSSSAGKCESFDEDLSLRALAGGTLKIISTSDVLLSELRLVTPSPSNDAVIMMLWDTTRRDAVGLYGQRLPVTPNLDAVFRNGVVIQRAYATASWTMPSTASLLSGRLPFAHEDQSGVPVGMAEGVKTLAEDFRDAGWTTAGFFANPTLNDTNGFQRGFSTFYTAPYVAASMEIPGQEMSPRLERWLRAHEGERFFLYIHYIDPHEPYGPPDRPKGTTPFDPGYTGAFRGDESHYALTFDLHPAPADVEHLRALYLDDVRYLDSVFGKLWNGLTPSLRDRATLVFASDHGEEFLEHGAWKHGPTLYDEVLRVPLAIRPRKGRTLPTVEASRLVSLMDVAPTIGHMFALPSRELDGIDLFAAKPPVRRALPPITMLTGGAARAAVVGREEKLLFFDRNGTRGVPDAAADPMGHRVAMHLRDILPSVQRFDLVHDPLEQHSLPADPAKFPAQWVSIETSLARSRRGIELRVLGGTDARDLTFTVTLDGSPASPETFAMEDDDRIVPSGASTSVQLHLPPGDIDGLLLPDGVRNVRIRSAQCLDLLAGASPSRVAAGGTLEVATASLGSTMPELGPISPTCASIVMWRSTGNGVTRSAAEEDEATKKLRAIGYVH